MIAWAQEVLDFWLSLPPERHFSSDPEFDAEVQARFLSVWEAERDGLPEQFLASADEALGATILFDQLPRNMFRGHADQFSTDLLAKGIAEGAIARGYDQQVSPAARAFFYLPFEHSEEMEDQRRSLLLFTALGDARKLEFARKHHDVIDRFGRFPHRNAMLGRRSTDEEVAFGLEPPW